MSSSQNDNFVPTPTSSRAAENTVNRTVMQKARKATLKPSTEQEVNEELIKSLQYIRNKEMDEDEIFCKMLANEFKKIKSVELKQIIKKKLFLTIMNATE